MFTTNNSNNIKNIINNASSSCCQASISLEIMKISSLTKELWNKGCLDHKPEKSLENHRGIMKPHPKRWSIKVMVIKLYVSVEQIQPIRWPKSMVNRKTNVYFILKSRIHLLDIMIFSLVVGRTSYIDGEIVFNNESINICNLFYCGKKHISWGAPS